VPFSFKLDAEVVAHGGMGLGFIMSLVTLKGVKVEFAEAK
jgi:hypothetical protein